MFSIQNFFNLKCQTVQVSFKTSSEISNDLVGYEDFLRRKAFKASTIDSDPSFFDNSDMISEYYLTVVYDKRTKTPLLSSRHFYHKETIQKKLLGENVKETKEFSNWNKINLENYKEGQIFLADRLSANSEHPLFIKNRNFIFLKYYKTLYKDNLGKNYFLMAKSEKFEKLLTKYIRLGLVIVGKSQHHKKVHWILFGDFNNSLKLFKRIQFLRMILLSTYLFNRKAN